VSRSLYALISKAIREWKRDLSHLEDLPRVSLPVVSVAPKSTESQSSSDSTDGSVKVKPHKTHSDRLLEMDLASEGGVSRDSQPINMLSRASGLIYVNS
jgi:hypothetical protein